MNIILVKSEFFEGDDLLPKHRFLIIKRLKHFSVISLIRVEYSLLHFFLHVTGIDPNFTKNGEGNTHLNIPCAV